MSKHKTFANAARDNDLRKYYILTRPSRLSDVPFDELDNDSVEWREKSRQLQIRRWRKLRHQLS